MMKISNGMWRLAFLLLIGASGFTQAAQWVNASGVTTTSGDEVTLIGDAGVRTKAEILSIPVTVGQTYMLSAQLRNSVAGNWTYIGLNNGGAITEKGSSTDAYGSVSIITFVASNATISVYGSFWQGQTGNGYVKSVALNGIPVIAGASSSSALTSSSVSSSTSSASSTAQSNSSVATSGGYTWANASGTTSVDNGGILKLTGSAITARAELQNITVTPGTSYTLTGNAYSPSSGYTYLGVVNGSQIIESGGSATASNPVNSLTFTATGSTITVYGSYYKSQPGDGYLTCVNLSGVPIVKNNTCGAVSSVSSSSMQSSNRSSSQSSVSSTAQSSIGSSISSSASSSIPNRIDDVCDDGKNYILCDDFNSNGIDGDKWTLTDLEIGNRSGRWMKPNNVSKRTVKDDNGQDINVVVAKMQGLLNPGIAALGANPTGGGLISKSPLPANASYSIRFRNPIPSTTGAPGVTGFWNYYDSYDADDVNGAQPQIYTEIDIEMPAHYNSVQPAPAWSELKRQLGFNVWNGCSGDECASYYRTSSNVNPYDGKYHTMSFIWRSNSRVDWYLDGQLMQSDSLHVPSRKAPLTIGMWGPDPLKWKGLDYNFDTAEMLIDWVKVEDLNENISDVCNDGKKYLLCDDFNSDGIDGDKWTLTDMQIGNKSGHWMKPGNVSRRSVKDDNGQDINVVVAKMQGLLNPEIGPFGYNPTGGGLISKYPLPANASYSVRFRNPTPSATGAPGVTGFWNYYDSYDADDVDMLQPQVYSEIDIEMPAHYNSAQPAPAWSVLKKELGFNDWDGCWGDECASYYRTSSNIDPYDGKFHTMSFIWRSNSRVDWYLDGQLMQTDTLHVPSHKAPLTIGMWGPDPAKWKGLDYNFDTAELFIDWVKVEDLSGSGTEYIPPGPPASSDACDDGKAYKLCDDFNSGIVDMTKWKEANLQIGNKSGHWMKPNNVSVRSTTVNGVTNYFAVATMQGLLNPEIGPFGYNPTGGGLISLYPFGYGTYEFRVKNPPATSTGAPGVTGLWNYYDSYDKDDPDAVNPEVYTEIDIEMPAHYNSVQPAPAWTDLQKELGLNTWDKCWGDECASYYRYRAITSMYDNQFHTYKIVWAANKVEWYLDGVLIQSDTSHVGSHKAPWTIGMWGPDPAKWKGLDYNFNTADMIIDWIKFY